MIFLSNIFVADIITIYAVKVLLVIRAQTEQWHCQGKRIQLQTNEAATEHFVARYKLMFWENHGCIVNKTGEHMVMIRSQSTPHSSQKKKKNTATLISKKKHIEAKWQPLQYSARFFVLEGIVWSGDAHKERVMFGVFIAVVHKVRTSLGYLQKQWKTKSHEAFSRSFFLMCAQTQSVNLINTGPILI